MTSGSAGFTKKKPSVDQLFVLIAHQLDVVIGVAYIRDAVIIGFIVNELISITENAGLMGVPLPGVVKKAIDILTAKREAHDGGTEN